MFTAKMFIFHNYNTVPKLSNFLYPSIEDLRHIKSIKRAFGEFNKSNMNRSQVQDSVYHMTFQMRFYCFQSLFISIELFSVVADVVMKLLVPAESIKSCVDIALFVT